MRIFFFAIAFCSLSIVCSYAQSLNEGMYSKEWEKERDKYVNDKKRASAGAVAARNAFLSYGKRNSSNWTKPTYVAGKGWTLRNINVNMNGIKMVNDNPVRTSMRTKNSRKVNKSSTNGNVSHFGEWHANMLKRARIKEEKIKQRKREEDDRSEIVAKAVFYRTTENKYRKFEERDRWHSNEGARIMDEALNLDDFINAPEPQKVNAVSYSGRDLADGIKPKRRTQGTFTIIYETPLVRKQTFKAGSHHLSVTNQMEIDIDVAEAWHRAAKEKAVIEKTNFEKNINNSEKPVLLVSKDEMCIDSADMFILPEYGLVLMHEDSMMILKDYELRSVSWKNNEKISYIVPCGKKLIGKSNHLIIEYSIGDFSNLMSFDTEDFSIFYNDDQSIFALFWYKGISSLIRIDVYDNMYDEVARLPMEIWKIEANGKNAFILLENSILSLDIASGDIGKLYSSDKAINDIVLTSNGLLIATDLEISRISLSKEQSIFYNEGAKRIWCEDNEIYIQDINGNLLYISDYLNFISNYKL